LSDRPTILFVCVHNAGRSQIAAALTRLLGGDRVDVLSAGSEPADQIHANVLAAMLEIGIDLAQERPKLLEDSAVEAADVVITMGCGDACPIYPGKRYMDWTVEDPAGGTIEDASRTRDDIRERVEGLLREMGVLAAP
jgi:arsenate reductase